MTVTDQKEELMESCQLWGVAYERDAFNVKMTLRNSIYLTKLFVFSVIFKHVISFQKKAINTVLP